MYRMENENKIASEFQLTSNAEIPGLERPTPGFGD